MVYCGRAGTGTAVAVVVGWGAKLVGVKGGGEDGTVEGEGILAESGVGVEQEARNIKIKMLSTRRRETAACRIRLL